MSDANERRAPATRAGVPGTLPSYSSGRALGVLPPLLAAHAGRRRPMSSRKRARNERVLLSERAGVNLNAFVEDRADVRRAALGLDQDTRLAAKRYSEHGAAADTVMFAVKQFHPRPPSNPGAD